MTTMIGKVFLLGLLFLAGCQVGPQYYPPELSVAEGWKSEVVVAETPEVENWWEIFHDETLTQLIERAIQNNFSLLAISQRVEQGRDFANVTKSRLFPQLNFEASASSGAQRVHSFGSTANPPPVLVRNQIDRYTLPLTLIYEFDFWGKWRSQYQSALYRAEAEEEGYRTALLLLTTDLANGYFQIRIQDAQIELYREILATRKKALDIQQSRFGAHLVNYTDVAVYRTDYSTVESDYYDALRKRALFENQIAVLVGASPSEFKLAPMPLKENPPQIPVSLPAKVLVRRPDLAEQERKMAAIHAEINVAYASYFPSIDGAGVLDFLSNDFVKTFRNSWLIGGNLVEVLFDAGGRGANVELFKAKFNEAAASYREKVLVAFQEVEDSLASLHWIADEIKSIESAIQATQISYRIAMDRYKFGLSSYLDAANNERINLEKRQESLQLLSQNYLYTVHLIKAIGGSWSCGL